MKYVYCFDLGTDLIKICDVNKKIVVAQKNAIAIKNKKELFAVGNKAYKMYSKSPHNIRIDFPMRQGVIADYNYMAYLLEQIIEKKKIGLFDKQFFIVAVPTDITDVERRAYYKLMKNVSKSTSGVGMVEKPIADCFGLGINISKTKGTFVVNLGADSTELSIVYEGGIFATKMSRYGGRMIEDAIEEYVRKKYQLSIGIFDKARLKKKLGNAFGGDDKSLLVAGISVLTGRPDEIHITSEDVLKCVRPYLERLLVDIKEVSLKASPEMANSIIKNGIYLVGGMSKLKNIDRYISKRTGVNVYIGDNPEITTVTGLKRVYENKPLNRFIFSIEK